MSFDNPGYTCVKAYEIFNELKITLVNNSLKSDYINLTAFNGFYRRTI